MTAATPRERLTRKKLRQMLLDGVQHLDGDVTLPWAVVKPWLNHEDYCAYPRTCDGTCQNEDDDA